MDNTVQRSSAVSALAAIFLTIIGASAFMIMPVMLGAATVDLHFSDHEVGYLSTAGLAAPAISAIIASLVVPEMNWHWFGYLRLACQLDGLLSAGQADGFDDALAPTGLASVVALMPAVRKANTGKCSPSTTPGH